MVYRIDLGDAKRGHEQRGRRYGVVLSRTNWSMVTVVPSSTSAAPARSRLEVTIAGTATRLLVDQVRSIDARYLVGDPVDYLSLDDMTRLDSVINNYLGLGPG
ncbi:type II toxin-antitoxin system PemK/MazF family toxin [Nocardia carnea]|uniref:type II toxin-antitoxin system PemK/MazF family toxin n=1 Tax=Nocardia carnea TaxID=37328 RepID=UPI00245857E0|nr:type II toxin-antitoxin system PemK/MazF family toxin [Nocardia carnea]